MMGNNVTRYNQAGGNFKKKQEHRALGFDQVIMCLYAKRNPTVNVHQKPKRLTAKYTDINGSVPNIS